MEKETKKQWEELKDRTENKVPYDFVKNVS
jgi:hypothetical protein